MRSFGERHYQICWQFVIKPFSYKQGVSEFLNRINNRIPGAGDIGTAEFKQMTDQCRCFVTAHDSVEYAFCRLYAPGHRAMVDVDWIITSEALSEFKGIRFSIGCQSRFKSPRHKFYRISFGMSDHNRDITGYIRKI